MNHRITITKDLKLIAPRAQSTLTVDQAFRLARDLLHQGARRAVIEATEPPGAKGRQSARSGIDKEKS